jgi:hypothetical protein
MDVSRSHSAGHTSVCCSIPAFIRAC